MNAHLFTADKGSKVCAECGKTRNAKAHKDARAAAKVEVTEAEVAEAREDMLPEVSAATDDSEIADALAALETEAEELVAEDTRTNEQVEPDAAQAEAEQAAKPAKKAAPPKKAPAKQGNGTASIWVGWRITNAAVLLDGSKAAKSLAAKLKAAKPTGDLDRTVRLTVDELRVLDTVAERFQKEGKTGPEIYSGRALRGRIAAAVAKIEAATKENDK